MREIILHVGMHKTGSSAIQQAMYGYDDGATRYAHFPEPNHSHAMYSLFTEKPELYHIWRGQGLSQREVSEKLQAYGQLLEAELSSKNWSRLIISGEDMSVLTDTGKEKLLKYFLARGFAVRVIGFVRHPLQYAASFFQQHLKGGASRVELVYPKYRKRFRHFFEMLSEEAVTLVDYDSEATSRRDVLGAFFDQLDLAPAQPLAIERVNESLSLPAIKLLLCLNRQAFETTGSHRHMQARDLFIEAVRRVYPISVYGRLSSERSAELLPSKIASDWVFCTEHMKIKLDLPSNLADPENVDLHLSDFSDFPFEKIAALLEELNFSPSLPGDPGSLVSSLYHYFLRSCP